VRFYTERKSSLGAVAVTRDDAPDRLIGTGWKGRNTDLEKRLVVRVDVPIAAIDLLTSRVFDAKRTEHRLDRTIEPDPHLGRRLVDGMADARLRVIRERVRQSRCGKREHGEQDTADD
jgi:hypothetical protein